MICKARRGVGARDEGDKLALIGNVQRIDPKQLGDAADLVVDRHGGLVDRDRDPGLLG